MNIQTYLQSLQQSGMNVSQKTDAKDIVLKNMYQDKEYTQHLGLPLFKRKSHGEKQFISAMKISETASGFADYQIKSMWAFETMTLRLKELVKAVSCSAQQGNLE